jgi:hypothetical protein
MKAVVTDYPAYHHTRWERKQYIPCQEFFKTKTREYISPWSFFITPLVRLLDG